MSLRKIVLIAVGTVSLIIGAIGAALPFLPSFPFLLLSACCYARSSERLDRWFKNTALYKNNLESYVSGNGMTKRTKIKVMLLITCLLGFGAVMMRQILWGQILLAVIWLFHMVYFVMFVKTAKQN